MNTQRDSRIQLCSTGDSQHLSLIHSDKSSRDILNFSSTEYNYNSALLSVNAFISFPCRLSYSGCTVV